MSDTPRRDALLESLKHQESCDYTAGFYELTGQLERENAELRKDADAYKSVLIGMEFKDVDLLPSKGAEFCLALGQKAAYQGKTLALADYEIHRQQEAK